MPSFSAPDGTGLAYHIFGDGIPVVCLPGGPMQDAGYLGELGGLSKHRKLIMLDPRGTGLSAIPDDTASYRCDRLVDDVEALREHLGLDQVDLLGHSAGANLATLYAARYPERVRKLALITPSTQVAAITATGQDRRETALLRKDEPWFAPAFAALEDIVAGNATDDSWKAIDPFFYGRWDPAAQAHSAAQDGHRNDEAAAIFGGPGAYDPEATRTALAGMTAPVLLLAGEVDLNTVPSVAAEFAKLFPNAELVVQPAAGHFPWIDDADRFVSTTATFLD
jgi:pimeloyl-ACP methyl ester carboxylesterase